jgi:hypothetical protein
MMCYDGYSVNCYPNKHPQRFEIISILKLASMKNKLYKLTTYDVIPDGVFF